MVKVNFVESVPGKKGTVRIKPVSYQLSPTPVLPPTSTTTATAASAAAPCDDPGFIEPGDSRIHAAEPSQQQHAT